VPGNWTGSSSSKNALRFVKIDLQGSCVTTGPRLFHSPRAKFTSATWRVGFPSASMSTVCQQPRGTR
jgi:hypothetical protein